MIRSLFKLALLAIVCIVIYNYFFGSASEKDQSRRIFKGVGGVFTEMRWLVRSEKDKFDAGKYDAALAKMQDVIQRLRSHATETNDPELKRQVAQLEQRKNALEQKVDAMPSDTGYQKSADKVKQFSDMAKQLESLTNDIQSIVNSQATTAEQQ